MTDLTDRQIDGDMSALRDVYIDAAREGWGYGGGPNVEPDHGAEFDNMIAAVEGRAARRERERITASIATRRPVAILGDYDEGLLDGIDTAVQIAKGATNA